MQTVWVVARPSISSREPLELPQLGNGNTLQALLVGVGAYPRD